MKQVLNQGQVVGVYEITEEGLNYVVPYDEPLRSWFDDVEEKGLLVLGGEVAETSVTEMDETEGRRFEVTKEWENELVRQLEAAGYAVN